LGDAGGLELRLVHAGENGDGEELGWIRQAGGGFGGGGEHGGASAGMDGEELRAERRDRTHRGGDGVGNVVEFQVEEDGVAAIPERLNDGAPSGEVEFEADFEPLAGPFKTVDESEGFGSRREVEGDDEALSRLRASRRRDRFERRESDSVVMHLPRL